MFKYTLIAFALMAFAFYELSGGEDFVSIADEKRALQAEQQKQQQIADAAAKAEREEQLAAQQSVAPAASVETTQVVLASASSNDTAPSDATSQELQAAVLAALDADAADQQDSAPLTSQAEQAENTEVVTEEVAQEEPVKDIREVTAARVNMRGGPGQNFDVLAKLTNGEKVEILQDPGDGWVKLQVVDSGRVGWMADFLLTAANTN